MEYTVEMKGTELPDGLMLFRTQRPRKPLTEKRGFNLFLSPLGKVTSFVWNAYLHASLAFKVKLGFFHSRVALTVFHSGRC